jgi:hypothetical protein
VPCDHFSPVLLCDQLVEALLLRPVSPEVYDLLTLEAEILRIGLQHEGPALKVRDSGFNSFELFEDLDRHCIKNGGAHAVTPSAASVPVELAGTGAETPIIKSAAFSALPAAYITRSASALIAVAQF